MKSNNRMTLTRADISESIYREIGLSKNDSADLVNSMLDHISQSLSRGENVKIAKFGSFKLSIKKERSGRNPKTGAPAIVSQRTVVTFKPSPYLSERVSLALKGSKQC